MAVPLETAVCLPILNVALTPSLLVVPPSLQSSKTLLKSVVFATVNALETTSGVPICLYVPLLVISSLINTVPPDVCNLPLGVAVPIPTFELSRMVNFGVPIVAVLLA